MLFTILVIYFTRALELFADFEGGKLKDGTVPEADEIHFIIIQGNSTDRTWVKKRNVSSFHAVCATALIFDVCRSL